MYSAPSIPGRAALEQGTEAQLLPGRCSINGCPLLWVFTVCLFTAVCVCTLDGLNAEPKFRVWVICLVVCHVPFKIYVASFKLTDTLWL